MRIAHVTAPAQFGGAERVIAGLTEALAKAGHEVSLVLTLTPGSSVPRWVEAVVRAGVQVDPVYASARSYLGERTAVQNILRERRVELIHSHGYRSDILHAGLASRGTPPRVSSAHGFASTDARGRLYQWLQLRAWRACDAVIAVSEPLHAALVQAGLSPDRVVLIPNSLPPGGTAQVLSRASARATLGLPADGAIVGWVGRFSEEKDPLGMIRAFAQSGSLESRLCMLGSGPLDNACRAAATAEGLGDRVLFPGAVADAGVVFPAFDVLALSSRTEGTPMVVLEAARVGVPVVATAVGGVPALLGDDAGWLVPAADPQALAAALDTALGERAESMRRAAKLAERLEGKAVSWLESHVRLYERLLA